MGVDQLYQFIIEQYPKVCQLLSGVFNKKPPKPNYAVIWDISKVIDYKYSR